MGYNVNARTELVRRHTVRRIVTVCALSIFATVTLLGMGQSASASDSRTCTDVRRAIVTDVDETLTTADLEFFFAYLNPRYDPAERSAASKMLRAYADRGYWIIYVTARPDGVWLSDGRSIRRSTQNWLTAHSFPMSRDRTMVYLAPDILSALIPTGYKAAVIKALKSEGFEFDYAYGNSDTDFMGFKIGGIPLDRQFSIGKLAGYGGTRAIVGNGFDDHLASHVTAVTPVCNPAITPQGTDASCPSVPYDGVFAWLISEWLGQPVRSHKLSCTS